MCYRCVSRWLFGIRCCDETAAKLRICAPDWRNRKGHEHGRKYARVRECFIHRQRKNRVNGGLSRALQISTGRYLRAFLMAREFSRLPFSSPTCLSQYRSFSPRRRIGLFSSRYYSFPCVNATVRLSCYR